MERKGNSSMEPKSSGPIGSAALTLYVMKFHCILLKHLLHHQIGISHQALVHGTCRFPALSDCPYHKGLSSVHIAGYKYAVHAGLVLAGRRLYISALIEFYGKDKIVSALSFYYDRSTAEEMFDKLSKWSETDTDFEHTSKTVSEDDIEYGDVTIAEYAYYTYSD